MKVSTRGRYALRMMVYLAKAPKDEFISLSEICESEGISKKYLEQIIPFLVRKKFLRATRGFRGGYRLARDPSAYSVGEVLRCTEGTLAPVKCVDAHCGGRAACDHCDECPTHPVWRKLSEIVSRYLDAITIQDVVDGNFDVDQEILFEDGSGI